MDWPHISVIIPTYAREAALRTTLAEIVEQDYPHYEVLVVDQTAKHESETEADLERLAAAEKIRWFRLDWASLPGARNYGVRRAEGEIIVFIDDDVRLQPGYLKAHARNFIDRPEIGAVAGRVLDPTIADGMPEEMAIEFLPPEAMDPGIAWYYIDLVHAVKPQQVLTARGCNMSFRRDIFDKFGVWFDERFRGSAVREESDFCLRIRQTGYKIWFDPEAVLVHVGEPTGGCHDVSTRSLQYQITHYHNHFWMAFKNLTLTQNLRLYGRLFDCHVLGNPPCYKSGSPTKIAARGVFYFWGFIDAIGTAIQSLWTQGQPYTRQDLQD
mgnify:CR=1 FL=1